MPILLKIQSSPNLEGSVTRPLVDKFVDAWTSSHANVEIDTLDLATEPVPHFGPEILAAGSVPPAEWSSQTRDAVALSDRLVTQLEAADVLVIGSPMINFTICSQLKTWFDHIAIAGRTFSYAAPGVAKGNLFGKKAFVIEGRGGDYADAPVNAFDFQEPLMRTMLGFLGVYDVTFVRAEGSRVYPEEHGAIVRNAESVIARLAA